VYLGLLEPRGGISSAAHSSNASPAGSLSQNRSLVRNSLQHASHTNQQHVQKDTRNTSRDFAHLAGHDASAPHGRWQGGGQDVGAASCRSAAGVIGSNELAIYDTIGLHGTEAHSQRIASDMDADSVASHTSQGVVVPPPPQGVWRVNPTQHPQQVSHVAGRPATAFTSSAGMPFAGLQSGFLTAQMPLGRHTRGGAQTAPLHHAAGWPLTHISGDDDGAGSLGSDEYLWDAGVDDTTSMQHSEAAREHEDDLFGTGDEEDQHFMHAVSIGATCLASGAVASAPSLQPATSLMTSSGQRMARTAAATGAVPGQQAASGVIV